MQRDAEAAKGDAASMAAQLADANASAEAGTKAAAQAHAEIQLLTHSCDELHSQTEQLKTERVRTAPAANASETLVLG